MSLKVNLEANIFYFLEATFKLIEERFCLWKFFFSVSDNFQNVVEKLTILTTFYGTFENKYGFKKLEDTSLKPLITFLKISFCFMISSVTVSVLQ